MKREDFVMERNVSLEEISDGKLYGSNDMRDGMDQWVEETRAFKTGKKC